MANFHTKNLANPTNRYILEHFEKSASFDKETCIFLSHITSNKEAVIKIGEYITNAGFYIYLDIYDTDLQRGVENRDDHAITECIEKGINNSTDMLCIVSEETKNSWWVPYEIGYGKKCENSISTLLLKDVTHIPSFLRISNHLLKGTKSLNEYLEWLSPQKVGYGLFEKSASQPNIINYTAPNHPLDAYLNWKE
ncbi:toll/interleukin-1 receptor domain-containing protein [Priestia aryabhattai]|uniref:toll/interleukin-1 receptor domain-containing protein n=1 Tax=Priestia aryabhattai TaxID=412384 RepID=UPI003D7F8A7F